MTSGGVRNGAHSKNQRCYRSRKKTLTFSTKCRIQVGTPEDAAHGLVTGPEKCTRNRAAVAASPYKFIAGDRNFVLQGAIFSTATGTGIQKPDTAKIKGSIKTVQVNRKTR